MIKITILVFSLLLTNITFAKNENFSAAEIVFKKGNDKYSFKLEENLNTKKHSLIQSENKKAARSTQITSGQANKIKQQITQIFWKTQYRTIANQKKCHPYAEVKLLNEVSTVCLENKEMVGDTYGLLNYIDGLAN